MAGINLFPQKKPKGINLFPQDDLTPKTTSFPSDITDTRFKADPEPESPNVLTEVANSVIGAGKGVASFISKGQGLITDPFEVNKEKIDSGQFKRETMQDIKDIGGADIIPRVIGAGVESLTTPKTFNKSFVETRDTGGGAKVSEAVQRGVEGKIGKVIGTIASLVTDILGPATILGTGKAVAKAPNAIKRVSAGLSGVSKEALEKASGFPFIGAGGRKAIQKKSGAKAKKVIAENLVDAVENFDKVAPEALVIEKALKVMPDIETAPILNRLNELASDIQVPERTQLEMSKLVEELSRKFGKKATPENFRKLRMRLDGEIGDFSKEAGKTDFVSILRQGRREAQDILLQNAPLEAKEAFTSMSNKLDKLDAVKSRLGKKSTTKTEKAQTFMNSLFGKDAEIRKEALSELEEILGESFLEQSQLNRFAAEFGDKGVPGLLPTQLTGKALLGPVIAGTAQNLPSKALAAGIGAATLGLSSPRLATTFTLPATKLGSNLAQKGLGLQGVGSLADIAKRRIERDKK